MGWRQRFDPASRGIDRLRERTGRLRDIRALGEQVNRVRRVGLRGEVLVPLVAALILAVTLGLSTFAPSPGDVATQEPALRPSPSVAPSATTIAGLPQTSIAGYPATDDELETSTAFAAPETETTEVITPTDQIIVELEPTLPSYPGPILPEGVGPPPGDGVPPPSADSAAPLPPVINPPSVPQVPPPALIPTTPPRSAADGAYPGPAVPLPQATANPPRTQPQPSVPRSTDPQVGAPQALPQSSPGAGLPDADGTEPSEDDTGSDGTVATPIGGPAVGTTPIPTAGATASPVSTPIPPTPMARSAEVLSGNIRWTTANSPVVLTKDHVVAAGSFLTIDPGVEVQLAADVRLTVAGTLRAGGNAAAPVRLVGPGGRWDGLVGIEGSTIALDGVELRQAGRNGTALSTAGGALVVRNLLLTDSGGGIVALRSVVDVQSTQITGNSIAGPAINVLLPRQNGTRLVGNIVGGNGNTPGAPQILLTAEETPGTWSLENNQIIGAAGPGVIVSSAAPISGAIRCNSFAHGTIGLQLTTKRPSLNGFNLAIDGNSFTGQARFGATGSLPFNVANNWWGDPSGPVEAQRNPQGRGVPVGVTLQFQPWLAERPACAPR